MSGATFFISSCAIVALTIVNLGIGPSINSKIGTWSSNNCLKISDKLEERIENDPNITEEYKEEKNREIKKCKDQKAMYEMEYTSFIFNAGIGFICILLGLFGLQKEMEKKTGIIGMALGVIGFTLTLVYVIFNGIVYTNYYDDKEKIYKIDGEGAVAELVEGEKNKYKCLYFNKVNDTEALYAKYSDLIKSQYNYNKELVDSFKDKYHDKFYCTVNIGDYLFNCAADEYWEVNNTYFDDNWDNEYPCKKLYYPYFLKDFQTYKNYDVSARFLTVLILSVFILLCHCLLTFSGFKLFKGAESI